MSVGRRKRLPRPDSRRSGASGAEVTFEDDVVLFIASCCDSALGLRFLLAVRCRIHPAFGVSILLESLFGIRECAVERILGVVGGFN